jgi:hypothetical protein
MAFVTTWTRALGFTMNAGYAMEQALQKALVIVMEIRQISSGIVEAAASLMTITTECAITIQTGIKLIRAWAFWIHVEFATVRVHCPIADVNPLLQDIVIAMKMSLMIAGYVEDLALNLEKTATATACPMPMPMAFVMRWKMWRSYVDCN